MYDKLLGKRTFHEMPSKPNRRDRMCLKRTTLSKYKASFFPMGENCYYIDVVAYGIKPRTGVYDGTRKMTNMERLDYHHMRHPYRKLSMKLPVQKEEKEIL